MHEQRVIPERIKLARNANQLSLQQLAEKMTADGHDITRAALSQYETGRIVPTALALHHLSRTLGAPSDFFFRPVWKDCSLHLLHTETAAQLRIQELHAFIQIELERYALLDDALGIRSDWHFPLQPVFTRADEEAPEALAGHIRDIWQMGLAPISSVCGLLESHGIYLIALPDTFGLRYVSGYESSRMRPFIFYTSEAFTDLFRVNLLKELAKFFITPGLEVPEELLNRFAVALLAPGALLKEDFGEKRTHISMDELSVAKQRYGASRRELMQRLFHLGIVEETYYNDFYQYINQHRFLWRDTNMSSVPLDFHETPLAYNRKHARAIEEGLMEEPAEKFF